MNEDKTACQCGNCRHYDGIGDRCVIRPSNKQYRIRWMGCGWCREFGTMPIRGFTVHGCTSTTAHFCPKCGKPLTEEAWTELERRIEGNDGTTD